MKVLLCLTVAVLVCGALAKNKKSEDNKVKIALYYESLCPDSKRFITEQLAPVWRDFKGSVKVKLVPYGKSTHDKVSGKWQFTCHHGPDECYGNKVQACILKDKVLADTEKMDLVICLMGQASPDKSLDTCLEKISKLSESTKLKQCASGTQGDNLLAGYGDKTDGVQRPLAFVPTIVVNEVRDNQGDSQGDNLLAGYGDKTDGVQRPLAFVPTIVVNEVRDNQGDSQGDNLLAGYGDKTDGVQRPLAFVPTIVVNEVRDNQWDSQGDNLLAGYGDKTDGVQRPLAFVPTIVVNEKFNQENQDAAFANLKSVICRVATGTKPSAC
ncbi:GILT-like protein 1 isoform X2 [Cydia amplana]